MSRYFYSDPLAAAWMQVNYQVVPHPFIVDEEGIIIETVILLREANAKQQGGTVRERYYIHSDSLPLLEPRVGDLIYITESKIGTLARIHDGNLKLFTGDWLMKPDRVYIIRRDGKPFFWPESEDA
jgi:hypothetical protein